MKPYVICHMVASKNGKVTGSYLNNPACAHAIEEYYRIHREFQADAFGCGRVTMIGSFTHGLQEDLSGYEGITVAREDYKAVDDASFYAVSFDRKGRLFWPDNFIHDEDPGYDNAHIIEVLCEDLVSDAYLAWLREKKISYIFGGKTDLDMNVVLEKLGSLFAIDLFLLEGGAEINGAFEAQGCIDETSLVIADIEAEDGEDLFKNVPVRNYVLKDRIELSSDVLWESRQKKR